MGPEPHGSVRARRRAVLARIMAAYGLDYRDDPTGVTAKDIEITKDDGGVQLHVAYDDSAPYVANVSLTVHFEKTVKVR